MDSAYCLLILAALSLLVIATPALGLDERCEALRNDLGQKGQRLRQYLDTASKFDNRDDSETVKAIGSKIAKLRDEILNLEKQFEACKGEKSAGSAQGLSTVKSEEGQHATKSCRELTKRLVGLVRTVRLFQRREHSLLSELTPQEKKEFREATQELTAVREALRSRCSAPSASRTSQHQTKPSTGN